MDSFFEKIKSSLENLEVPFEPETWDLLTKKMEAGQAISDPMDVAVRESLGNFEVPFEAGSWDLFSKKLDAIENPVGVADVDKVVARGLANLEADFQPGHWDLMSQKLDENERRRRRMLFVKLAEAAIFLLLVWNLADILPGGKQKTAPFSSKKEMASAENSSENPSSVFEKMAATAKSILPNSFSNAVLENENSGENQFANQLLNGENLSENEILQNPNLTAQTIFSENENAAAANPDFQKYASNFLPFGAQLSEIQHDRNIDFQKLTVKNKKEKHFYISNYATAARQKVNTPFDEKFDKAAYSQKTNSFGGGVALGFRKKKWGAETGLVYTSTNYHPEKTLEITGGNALAGFTGIYLSEIDLDVVSVPVQANRRLAKFKKVEIRATAGATAHFATATAHRYREIKIPATSGGNFPNRTAGHEPGKGIFEGGKFSENTWLTAEAGVRLEVPVGKNAAFFAAADISKPIAGNISPKNDRIGGMNFSAGVMARL